MKDTVLVVVASLFSLIVSGQKLDQVSVPVNTTIKQIGVISNVNIDALSTVNNGQIGISTSQSALYYQFKKGSGKIIFEVSGASELLATGLNTKSRSKNKVVLITCLLGYNNTIINNKFINFKEGLTMVEVKNEMMASNENTLKEFKREVSTLTRVRHPNLVLFMGAR